MAFDTPRATDTADMPRRGDHKRARTVLIAVASACGALGLRHRLIEPITGTPELRVWNPKRGGPTTVVRDRAEGDPDRRGRGLALLVRVDGGEAADKWTRYNPPSFSRMEDDDATGAAKQIAQMLEEGP